MAKLQYPGFGISEAKITHPSRLTRWRRRVADVRRKWRQERAEIRAERQRKKEYYQTRSKNIPLVPWECVKEARGIANVSFAGMMAAVAICIGVCTVDIDQWDFHSLSGRYNPLIIWALGTWAFALLYVYELMVVRREMILRLSRDVDVQTLTNAENKDLIGPDGKLNTDVATHVYNVCKTYEDSWFSGTIKSRLFETEFAMNPSYFKCMMHPEFPSIYAKKLPPSYRTLQAIIENHLKTHPADIKRVMEVYDINTIPAAILKKYDKKGKSR